VGKESSPDAGTLAVKSGAARAFPDVPISSDKKKNMQD